MSEDDITKPLSPDESEKESSALQSLAGSTDPIEKLGHNVEEILATLQNMNERLTALEAKSYDTKPIWERALAEIAETRQEMAEGRKEMNTKFRNLDRKFDQLAKELFEMRASISDLDSRVADLESKQS